MSTLPFVTVIVPVRNGARVIGRCIEALLAQTYPRQHYEIIVVDNGSTDDTRDVVARYPVTLLVEESMPSPYPARNLGIRHARGEVLAFTDSDCVPVPRWLEAGIEALQNQGADLVGGRVTFMLSPEKTVGEMVDSLFTVDVSWLIEHRQVCPTANLLVWRRLFEQLGVFPDHVRSGGDTIWTHGATSRGCRLVFASDAEVHKPARKLVSMLRKQYRLGFAQPENWRRFDMSPSLLHTLNVRGFLPLHPGDIHCRIIRRGNLAMMERFPTIWLLVWLRNIVQGLGRIHRVVRIIMHREVATFKESGT